MPSKTTVPKTEKPKAKKTKKTAPVKTLIAVILDETGSMMAMKEEVINGFNKYIDDLSADGNDYLLTLVQFDSMHHTVVHSAVPVKEVPHLTNDSYRPGSSTPLYDAIGKVIKATDPSIADKVLIAIFTDGQENSSREYSKEAINAAIKEKESVGWTFTYLGVGKDAWANEHLFTGTVSAQNVSRSFGGSGMTAQTSSLYSRTARYASSAVGSVAQVIVTDEEKKATLDASS